jgi:hypothetical protein
MGTMIGSMLPLNADTDGIPVTVGVEAGFGVKGKTAVTKSDVAV